MITKKQRAQTVYRKQNRGWWEKAVKKNGDPATPTGDAGEIESMKTQRCKCGNSVQGMARTQKAGTILEIGYCCASCLRRWKTQEPNPNYKPIPDEQLRKFKNDE